MSSPEHKQKIWSLIKDIKVGMLVSKDPDIGSHGRPMQLVQDEYNGRLFFFTKLHAEKIDEVQYKDSVCVCFSDPEKNTYVSMTGFAKINQDKALIDKLWNKAVSAWFPEGKDSSNVALLEIKVEHGEHWDSTSSSVKAGYEMMKANIKNEHPDLGENQKF